MASERHIVFIDELLRHSDREVCIGAAQYAAEQPGWVIDPWPVIFSANVPTARDLLGLNGILTNERAMPRELAWLRRLNIPVVYYLAARAHPRADSVAVDEVAVGRLAAEHLWGRGYRQFAFIGSSSFGWSKNRAQGFSEWLSAAGKKPANYLFTTEELPVFWSWNLPRRNQYMQELITRLPKPCGIMAANDVIACFILQAARQNHLRVPDVFGVVGVDNDPFPNAAAGLAISSVELPFRELGRQAARLLQERWQKNGAPRRVILPPVRVVVRNSTDAFMSQNPLVRRAQAYIELHRHERISVQQVTRAVASNRVTLGKYFQREFNTTLIDYLRGRRLAYAQELLRQGDHSVDETAWKCGFSSTSYFSKVFKTVTNQRPGALRRIRST